MSDTVTLALQGDVLLAEFSEAVAHFHGLVAALSAESQAQDVVWEIDALDYSSAITTARGVPPNGGAPERIDRVVRAYLEVGQALEQHATVPYPAAVTREAESIVRGLKGSRIEAVRFETAESEAIIRIPSPDHPIVVGRAIGERKGAYGAVTGRIQTLTSRNALRFTVYDHLHDRAVSCYLVEGQESMMRQMWDRVATVEGWITRDPESGRPLTVRRIARVTPLAEAEPQDYQQAQGALPLEDGDPKPEDIIRRLRDAG